MDGTFRKVQAASAQSLIVDPQFGGNLLVLG